MPNGGFGFSDIIDAIGSGLSDLGLVILNALIDVVNFLLAVASFIYQVLLVLLNFLGKAFPAIGSFFKWLVTTGFKDFLSKAWREFLALKDLIRRILDPVLQLLRRYRDYLDHAFNLYLRPILKTIQSLRSALTLLRLLHFKFAARLDSRLADIEGRLAGVFLDIRRQFNVIGNYLNLILDPLGLFNPFTFGASIVRSAKDLWSVVVGFGARPLTASESDAIARNNAFVPVDSARGDLNLALTTGDMPDPDGARKNATEFLEGVLGSR